MKTEELERKRQILDQHQQNSQKEAVLIVATQLLEEMYYSTKLTYKL